MGDNRYSDQLTSALLLIAITGLLAATEAAEVSELDRSFLSNGNLRTAEIETQSGQQTFVVNRGFLEGANKTKLFGENRPSTLWSDERRIECYEMTLRIMAQLPSGGELDAERAQSLLKSMGVSAEVLDGISKSLDALNTSYVDGSTLVGNLQNPISKTLRSLNPKTVNGVKIPCTNLRHLGQAMETLNYVSTAVDFAIGAAVQEALSGDIALARLDYLDSLIKQQSATDIDPAILMALSRAKRSLVRSSDYWGALITELHDRRNEVQSIGAKILVRNVQKDAVQLLTKYYAKSMGAKAAATKASTVGGLWAFSLIATYETIDALLEQHKLAQMAVTSATVAHLMAQTIADGKAQADDSIQAMILQSQYFYHDQMVKAASGLLPAFYDLLSKGQPYGDVKAHFAAERSNVLEKLHNLKMLNTPYFNFGDVITNSIGMRLVYIPSGEFWMGSKLSEAEVTKRYGGYKGWFSDEYPRHRVEISKGFYMGTTEVTRGQFAKFVQETGYRTDAEKRGWASTWNKEKRDSEETRGASWRNPGFSQDDSHPVTCVSWSDAVAFCRWLSRKTNSMYRLPTEAEWEYACRAGTENAYQWGDSADDGAGWANPRDLSSRELFKPTWSYFDWSDGYVYTCPVACFQSNSYGLYDMHGNVWEWCSDWYDKDYYSKSQSVDPKGPKTGSKRVRRGGSWGHGPEYCRSSYRGENPPDFRFSRLGFRVVLELN